MSTTCNESQQLLPWIVNGTLTSMERVTVMGHLLGCARCRGELALLLKVNQSSMEMIAPQLPLEKADRLFADVLAEVSNLYTAVSPVPWKSDCTTVVTRERGLQPSSPIGIALAAIAVAKEACMEGFAVVAAHVTALLSA